MQADAVSGEPYPLTLTSFEGLAVDIRCSRGQEICGPSGSSEYWYRVVSGSARRCVIRFDGRRQILDLLLPGNFFGFSDPFEQDSNVEAIAKGTVIAAYPRKRIESLADKNPRLACEIRQVSSKALERSRAYLLILGRITAREKVGAFLLNMAERTQGPANTFILPVSRYDIADCLGLSAETVCRSLTELRQQGKIALHKARCVTILDRQRLEEGNEDGGALLAQRKPRSRE
jgi:CRP/FNR family nitrogen fixation transcriptional regulator